MLKGTQAKTQSISNNIIENTLEKNHGNSRTSRPCTYEHLWIYDPVM